MIHVAFLCHCDTAHNRIEVFDENGEEIKNVVKHYIDPYEGCKSFEDLKDKSIDIMFTIYCPLYVAFKRKFNRDFYPNAFKKYKSWDDDYLKNMQEAMDSEGKDIKVKLIIQAIFEDGFKKLKNKGKLVIPFDVEHHPSNFIKYVREEFPKAEFTFEISDSIPINYGFYSRGGPIDTHAKKHMYKYLIITKFSSQLAFKKDLKKVGKTYFLMKFLTPKQFHSRMISSIELDRLIQKIKKVYPKVTKKRIKSLFSKEPISGNFIR